MTYDHAKKAGNQGDIWKHFVLVTLADKMPGNSDTIHYIECHAGAPIHNLKDPGEWQNGIGKVIKGATHNGPYVDAARNWFPEQYPASWVFVAGRLARRFKNVRVTLFDTSEDVAAHYQPDIDVSTLRLPDSVRVKFRQENGYDAARREAADLVFLDPPFSATEDWRLLEDACQNLVSRNIVFVAWYPLFQDTDSTCLQKLSDSTKSSAWEVVWENRPSEKKGLKGCGMLMSNDLASLLQDNKDELITIAKCMGSEMFICQPSGVLR